MTVVSFEAIMAVPVATFVYDFAKERCLVMRQGQRDK